jgi:hypothetical protein
LGGGVGDVAFGADREAEEHAHDDERDRRIHHLDPDVVLALARDHLVVGAALPAVADHDEDDQAVDDEPDDDGDHDEDPPQIA